MSAATFTKLAQLGPAFTGLNTIGYALYSSSNTLEQALTTTGVSEVTAGSGTYQVQVTFTDALGYGRIDWYQGATYLGSDEVGEDAVLALQQQIATASITLLSPVLETGAIVLVVGDDYLAADDRALQWTGDGWPDITDATIELILQRITSVSQTTISGTALSSTEAQVQIPSSTTSGLTVGSWTYALKATLVDSSIVTLARGPLTVSPQPAFIQG